MTAHVPARPFPVGRRLAVLLTLALIGLFAGQALGLRFEDLVPRDAGARSARRFLAAALHPRLPDEAPLGTLAGAVGRTIGFAAMAMALAVVLALPLGVLCSERFWRDRGGPLARSLAFALRSLCAFLRSIHELLWGVLMLAALGLNSTAAVIAMTVPFVGILGKVWAELIDEAPGRGGAALRDLGASPTSALLIGVLPVALPDLAAYAFYRFECAVRASAVLGFFGFPTLGFHLRLAIEDGDPRLGWTYLYAILGIVLLLEAWSAALRRRVVA